MSPAIIARALVLIIAVSLMVVFSFRHFGMAKEIVVKEGKHIVIVICPCRLHVATGNESSNRREQVEFCPGTISKGNVFGP